MNRIMLSLVTITGALAAAGCTAPVGSQDDGDTEVGEAQQAIHTTLGCSMTFLYLGTAYRVVVQNNTGWPIEGATVHYTVSHYNTTTKYYGIGNPGFTLLLADGATKTYNPSALDPDVLQASTCTAYADWEP